MFDEGYGSKVPFLKVLGRLKQKFVAEVPVNFTVRRHAEEVGVRADEFQPAGATADWARFRVVRKTVADQVWRARATRVWAAGGWHRLVTAVSEKTGEVKYFISNAMAEPLERLLRVAFRRATIEHAFRLAKQEAGLMHYEGHSFPGLQRHLILALVVLGFVAEQTERLRGKKSGGDSRAGVPGIESPLRNALPPTPGHTRTGAHQRRDPVPSGPQSTGPHLTQEAATGDQQAYVALYC